RTTPFETAGGKVICEEEGTIHGVVHDPEGKEFEITIKGALMPNLKYNLLPVSEGMFSQSNSWVKYGSNRKIKVNKTGRAFTVQLTPVDVSRALIATVSPKSDKKAWEKT